MIPRRLYRTLKPAGPLFEFTADDGTRLTDGQIRSVAIKRGKTGRGGGVHPSTAEVAISGFGSVRTGLSCSVALTEYGTGLLVGLSGAGTGIRPRFTGRIGRQSVNDTGAKQGTSFLAASWTAQLSRDKTLVAPVFGDNVATIIGRLMTPPKLPLTTPSRANAVAQYGYVYKAPEPGTYADLIGKYTTDLGVLVRENRNGTRQIQSHVYRRDRALSGLASAVPLTRSQALSPATWEQANDMQPRNYRLSYTNNANGITTATYGEPDSTTAETVDMDLSEIKFTTDVSQPTMEAFGRRAADWQSSYALPSLTVDLLMLLTSKHDLHRAQAAKLLSMEVGDPIYLSGDWHNQLRGIHYAEALNETITPDGWTIELSLVPAHVAIGEVSPAVPARTWESATYPWAEETRAWAKA